MRLSHVLTAAVLLATATPALADSRVGSVPVGKTTTGLDIQIFVDRYEDPKVPNVIFYFSNARDAKGSPVWLFDNVASRDAIDCIASGPVVLPPDLPDNEQVFPAGSSRMTHEFEITRIVDRSRSNLVYVIRFTEPRSTEPVNLIRIIHPEAAR